MLGGSLHPNTKYAPLLKLRTLRVYEFFLFGGTFCIREKGLHLKMSDHFQNNLKHQTMDIHGQGGVHWGSIWSPAPCLGFEGDFTVAKVHLSQ